MSGGILFVWKKGEEEREGERECVCREKLKNSIELFAHLTNSIDVDNEIISYKQLLSEQIMVE